MSSWFIFGERGFKRGHISGFLCCTSCVPEGKHVGQKDDTRENSCVTESRREREGKREEEKERERRRMEDRA